MSRREAPCNIIACMTICCGACCIVTILLVMVIVLAIIPYYIIYQDVFSALMIEEDANGSLNLYVMAVNKDKCFYSIPHANQTIYAAGGKSWIYEDLFGRSIGHKLAMDAGCAFGVSSWYKKTDSNVECPNLTSVTPPTVPVRKLTKCDVYDIEVSDTNVKQKQTIWVEHNHPVVVEYWEYNGGELTTHTKNYYVSYNATKPDSSKFVVPSNIKLVDLSKRSGSYTERSSPRREFLMHINRWEMFKSWLGINKRDAEESTKRKYHLLDMFKPRGYHTKLERSNGRLIEVPEPNAFVPSTRSVRRALDEIGEENIPKEYDVRTQYGTKCPTTKSIYNQGQCGCCWAMAAATVFSDRACIATDGAVSSLYSTQYLINCQNVSNGCNGGFTQFAWKELVLKGIVTDECVPFEEEDQTCAGDVCVNASMNPHKLYAKTAYSPFSDQSWEENVKVIQADIMKYGSVEASYYVFSDFMKFGGGVYKRKSNVYQGGHAVRVIGWGENDADGPYWIVANSWGYDWCENGIFRIVRGTDDCGFEDSIVAGEINV